MGTIKEKQSRNVRYQVENLWALMVTWCWTNYIIGLSFPCQFNKCKAQLVIKILSLLRESTQCH